MDDDRWAKRQKTTHEISTTSGFYSLPVEVHGQILQNLVETQEHPRWAPLASVCKEWQPLVEKQTFRRLKLRAPCLDEFERVTQRIPMRRKHIRHVFLQVDLPEYGHCSECESYEVTRQQEREKTRARHLYELNDVICEAVGKLFCTLGTWESGVELGRDLTLELNAHSPTDAEHYFQHLYFGDAVKKVPGWWKDKWYRRGYHHPPHTPVKAILPLFGRIDLHHVWKQLPTVDTVTQLVVRRQTRRRLSHRSLELLFSSLASLEHLTYEPWRHWERDARVLSDTDYPKIIANLPPSIKKLSVFEEFSDAINERLSYAPDMDTFVGRRCQHEMELARIVDPRVGEAFAQRSIDLEQLSIAYMINAEDFFGWVAKNKSALWGDLTSLALTSQCLQVSRGQNAVNDLLCAASRAARQMPKLRTLALWYGQKVEACAFIYESGGDDASITWRGTWGLRLSPDVVDAWELVAESQMRRSLSVRHEDVEEEIRSHGDAIHFLDLPCPVIAPESLRQIRSEHVFDDE